MKLLLDENISRRLLTALAATYPDSSHVALQGLERASDRDVWEFAKRGGYTLVSKDDDFTALSILHGRPPFLIKLSFGNCPNERVAQVLVSHHATIVDRFDDPATSMVELVAPAP